jgi:hypothetical protein
VPINSAGKRYSYYLIWITKLARDKPQQKVSAKISEVVLLQSAAG